MFLLIGLILNGNGKGEKIMYKDLMPIGSVVLLKGGEKRLMICSRVVVNAAENTIYDYAACLYPEGIVDSSNLYFFNHDAIDEIYFIGFQDREEMDFRAKVLSELDGKELDIQNGQIVLKKGME